MGGAGLALRLTGWCQDKWICNTGSLIPRKRRDITENGVKHQTMNKNENIVAKGDSIAHYKKFSLCH